MTGRTASLRHRPSRSVAAGLVAALLIAIGALGAWAAVTRLSTGTWPGELSTGIHTVTSWTWSSPTAIGIAALITILGLALLVAAVKPGPPSALVLAGSSSDREVVLDRRSIGRRAAAAARVVSGVDHAGATVGGSRVLVSIRTSTTRTSELRQAVTETVERSLADLGLEPTPRVNTVVRSGSPTRG